MITYTKHQRIGVCAYCGDESLWIKKRGFDVDLEDASRVFGEEDSDKDQFLAFVRQHHDADTVEFIEKWIAAREPKGEHFRIQAVPMRIRRDGTFQINAGQGDWWDFDTDGQRELVAKLTENLTRHGVEVGT